MSEETVDERQSKDSNNNGGNGGNNRRGRRRKNSNGPNKPRNNNGNRGKGGGPNKGGNNPPNEDIDEAEFEAYAGVAGDGPILNLSELKQKTAAELMEMAQDMQLENLSRMRKQDLIFAMLKGHAKSGERIYGDGVLEILSDGFGFLRSNESSYMAGPDDIYVSPSQIRRFSLRTGDNIEGRIRPPKESERYFALLKVDKINEDPPEKSKGKVLFENLTPLFPTERLHMELGNGSTEDITARTIDLVAPFGKGQRGLIVSPPKAGKTMMMQNIAQSIATNHPDCHLIVLLIDERPEEVTDFKRSVPGERVEVVSSTFDEPAARHIRLADMVIKKAKSMVESGDDVIILLDSITRLARACNTEAPSNGKLLSGGLEATALQFPKRFFGAARKLEDGGSLTILGTALIETGSKMDEVIFEEFKGTGNSELILDRKLSDKRVFPSIDVTKSGTRKEELLVSKDDLSKMWILRKILMPMGVNDSMEFLIDKIKGSKNNADFFESMKS